MDRRGCSIGNIGKMCLYLSITLLLLSCDETENSFVSALPAEERYQAKRTGTPRKNGVRRMMIIVAPAAPQHAGWVNRSRSRRGRGP
ncbi:unnamed protein product [Eruca vesicaria subsp. sativa]|uniref:Uncharacterized protein n=1 Tax=Eruca vesicaria subsp. sativa TaxID=29727 RepID=A0ABC8JJX4_ERUVS|nr:unnamed protein product [Eruca vesicaria subsp. sativa]